MKTPPDVPLLGDISTLAGGTTLGPVWTPSILPISLWWFFARYWLFVNVPWSILSKDSRKTLWRSLKLSPYEAILSLVFCPTNSSFLGLPEIQMCFPNIERLSGSIYGSFYYIVCWKISLGSRLEQPQGSSCLYPFSWGSLLCILCCSVSEDYCFAYFVLFFNCLRQEDVLIRSGCHNKNTIDWVA